MSGENVLRFLGVGNMLEREYRNTPAFQWARELVRNGIEANAKNIQIGVEWRAVETNGVYRLQYADDGYGMSREDLRTYMSTLGKGGKIVGGPHDNYAIGCRMTLLPWNPEGVVVISLSDGDLNMVKMKYDPAAADGAGEYILEEIEWEDEAGEVHRSTVYPPYPDPDLDIDWVDTVPDLITDAGHGTTFVLLGRSENEDTLNGDADRGENIRELTRKYFNIRFWELPDEVTLRCIEFIKPSDRATWPRSATDNGLYQSAPSKGRVTSSSTSAATVRPLSRIRARSRFPTAPKRIGGRRQPDVETGGVGASSGFIGVLYRKELFGLAYAGQEDGEAKLGANVYRQYGIGVDSVRRRVFIVLEPPEYDEAEDRRGVAPSTGRADLYWMGAGLSSRSVKPSDWAGEFAERMPDAIQNAINATQESVQTNEQREERLKRVMDRLSKRWRTPRARATEEGDTTTRPTSLSPAPRQRPEPANPRVAETPGLGSEPSSDPATGTGPLGQPGVGTQPAKSTAVRVGYPECVWVVAEDIHDEGMMAAWEGPNATHPHGLIQLDKLTR